MGVGGWVGEGVKGCCGRGWRGKHSAAVLATCTDVPLTAAALRLFSAALTLSLVAVTDAATAPSLSPAGGVPV